VRTVRARLSATAFSVFVAICAVSPVFAQAPAAEPPKIWTVTASAGLALTSGNSDTVSTNAAYDITYDPHRRNVIKSDGLFLRARTEGELTADRLGFNVRDQYPLTPRFFVFAQNQYLRDEFKNIDYLVAPTGGVGYKLIDTIATKLSVDGSTGVVWEKNPGFDVKTSGALATGEKLTQTLTATATFVQSFTGLWKMDDFEDALFTLGASIAASMSARTQLKAEALNTYKNKPPLPTVQKNDVAVLMAIVFKM
jgi:putative salt-induced outer membrane protein YdiY